jgi:hypothetical protein
MRRTVLMTCQLNLFCRTEASSLTVYAGIQKRHSPVANALHFAQLYSELVDNPSPDAVIFQNIFLREFTCQYVV